MLRKCWAATLCAQSLTAWLGVYSGVQFGPGKMQQHGFARNLDWAIGSTSANPNPDLPDPTVSETRVTRQHA